ncbi:glycosyltransferase family 2 protein [Psychroserpens sp. MEBiC05023]
MNPFFSVIISVYNKEAYISNTLNSVLNQTYTDFEVIVINDGSTDHSLKILSQFKDSRITIINQDNLGASQARNHGMRITQGQYIALLDGDDFWDKYYLENIHTLIKQYPNQSVFSTAIAHKHGNTIIPVKYSIPNNTKVAVLNYFEASEDHTILSGSSTVFKTTILKITGDFDSTIRSGEDTDLWIRIGLHFPIVFLNKVLVYYVQNQNSLSNTNTNLSTKPKFDKYFNEEKNNPNLKKFLDKNRFSLAILAKLNNDQDNYHYYRNALSKQSLSFKRQLLLITPTSLLKLFLKFKSSKNLKTYYPFLEDTK